MWRFFLFMAIVLWTVIGMVVFMEKIAFADKKFIWPKVEWKRHLLIFLCGPAWWIGLTIEYCIDTTKGWPAKIKQFFYEDKK